MPTSRARQSGMTLIEIMVVVVILGLLATLITQSVLPHLAGANETKARSDVQAIADAAKLYQMKNGGQAPESLDLLRSLDRHGQRYLVGPARDPWGNDYQLRTMPGAMPRCVAVSFGPDRQPDTADDIQWEPEPGAGG
jgi:general secretion pathway protein G